MKKDKLNNLDADKIDLAATIAKSAVGWIPFAGSLLAEIVQTIIPNQRIDRLIKYVQILDEKLSKFEKSYVENALTDENCVSLFEEGFYQASKAITDVRRKYIASIMENGLDENAVNFEQLKHILLLIQEMNDAEIIWLRYYLSPYLDGDDEFRKKHKSILDPIATYIGVDDETMQKAAIQENYKSHIERLGLIKPHYSFDRATGIPEFDKFTGAPKVKSYSITTLGKMVLKYIDLYDENA